MKKMLTLAGLLLGSASAFVVVFQDVTEAWKHRADHWSKTWFMLAPPELEPMNDLQRQDLLRGTMPEQRAPTEQSLRPVRDQRPTLRSFTLVQNQNSIAC